MKTNIFALEDFFNHKMGNKQMTKIVGMIDPKKPKPKPELNDTVSSEDNGDGKPNDPKPTIAVIIL
ncbi:MULTISPECIES: hypothetical protein [Flavobacterium]|uniref:Uncharacterized protein n=1 Tax=Flavobacterium jumunjinense TaxID=998845 RepID=A0ABV5GRB0_9FLAO|nr:MULTISPECIES: hypothetical protein [Flavobacterium]